MAAYRSPTQYREAGFFYRGVEPFGPPVAGTWGTYNALIDIPSVTLTYGSGGSGTPPSFVEGDLGIFISVRDGDTSMDSQPSGFTDVGGYYSGGAAGRANIKIGFKDITSTPEPSSYDVDYSTSTDNGDARMNMFRLPGSAPAASAWLGASGQSGTDSTAEISSITTTTDNEMLFCVIAGRDGAEVSVDPPNWTLLSTSEVPDNVDKWARVYYRTVPTASTVASETATLVSGKRWQTFVFRVAAAADVHAATLPKIPSGSSVLELQGRLGPQVLPFVGSGSSVFAVGAEQGPQRSTLPTVVSSGSVFEVSGASGPQVLPTILSGLSVFGVSGVLGPQVLPSVGSGSVVFEPSARLGPHRATLPVLSTSTVVFTPSGISKHPLGFVPSGSQVFEIIGGLKLEATLPTIPSGSRVFGVEGVPSVLGSVPAVTTVFVVAGGNSFKPPALTDSRPPRHGAMMNAYIRSMRGKR